MCIYAPVVAKLQANSKVGCLHHLRRGTLLYEALPVGMGRGSVWLSSALENPGRKRGSTGRENPMQKDISDNDNTIDSLPGAWVAQPYFQMAAFIWPEWVYGLEQSRERKTRERNKTTKNTASAYSPDVLSLMLKTYGGKTRTER